MRFILPLLLTLLSPPAWANECRYFRERFSGPGEVSTDQRAHAIAQRVMGIAGINGPYMICAVERSMLPTPFIFMNMGERRQPVLAHYVLLMPQIFIERAPERVLLGLFAHEFAHTIAGHEVFVSQAKQIDPERIIQGEVDADVQGARWVGADVMLETSDYVFSLIEVRARELSRNSMLPFGQRLEDFMRQMNHLRTVRDRAIREVGS